MKSREEWIQEQEAYLKEYDKIKQELLQIPGVVDVGVGIKETDGGLTKEVAYRVYVEEKLPESNLSSEHIIPKTIHGFRTDVIKQRDERHLIGFNDENDEKNYKTKVGGICIGSKNGGGGTLGCFCRRNSDNQVVFLSNHHVLLAGQAVVGSPVGQPDYKEKCCCVCNKIGVIAAGTPPPTDCAIATLDSDIPFFPKIRKIKNADGTTELSGVIAGPGVAVMNDEVWKVGQRTGLTRGTISQITPKIEIHPLAPFTKIGDHGDSGSVVVRLGGDVVGLLRSRDNATGNLGFATPIQDVLTAMNITIIPTDETQNFGDLAAFEEEAVDLVAQIPADSPFAALAQRIQSMEGGQQLLQIVATHRSECLDLVNHRRAVTVAWQRNQGPTFLAALGRSAKEPSYRIPHEIQGVTREQALNGILQALAAHGSEALRADIAAYSDLLIGIVTNNDTVDELLEALQEIVLEPA
jgi:hypothetical protein